MSRPEIIICDKCGKEIPSFRAKQETAKIQLWGIGVNRYDYGQRIDLCEECFENFINFMEMIK